MSNHKRSRFDKVAVTLAMQAFKKLLQREGVGGLAASIATHFVFKYIFKPIANHLIAKRKIDSYQYTEPSGWRVIVHQKGVQRVKKNVQVQRTKSSKVV